MITTAKINGVSIINAQQLISQLEVEPDWTSTVNQLEMGLGAEPGRGTFLISRQDFLDHWPESEPFSIELNGLELKGFVTVRAQQALRMVGGPMLVTVADRRHLWDRRSTARKWDNGTDWQDIANDLKADLKGGSEINLAIPYAGDKALNHYRYDGISTLKAIEDFAFRIRAVLVFDPFLDMLLFQPFYEPQAEPSADMYRHFQASPPPSPLRWLHTLSQKGYQDQVFHQAHDLGGGDPNSRSISIWTMAPRSSNGDATDETDLLKQAVEDLALRESTPVIKEFFGFQPAICGGRVSRVLWKMDGPLATTTIWRTAPNPTLVERRPGSHPPCIRKAVAAEAINPGSSGQVILVPDDQHEDSVYFTDSVFSLAQPTVPAWHDWLSDWVQVKPRDMLLVAKLASGDDERWQIIKRPDHSDRHFRFVLTEDMVGGSGLAQLTMMNGGPVVNPDQDDPLEDIVLDQFGIFGDLDEGTKGIAIRQFGLFYIIQAQCDPDESDNPEEPQP